MRAGRAAQLALLFALASCGTVDSTNLEVPREEKLVFEFQDHRPPPERTSARSASRGEVLTRLGDDRLTPPGPTLLRTWLHTKGPAALQGKRVVLQDFVVQVYEPHVEAHPAAHAVPIVGQIVGHTIAEVASAKLVTVRIVGTVDGQEFAALERGSFKGRVSEKDINSVIRKTLDAAVTRVAEILAANIEALANE
jgi:hypothetical protein